MPTLVCNDLIILIQLYVIIQNNVMPVLVYKDQRSDCFDISMIIQNNAIQIDYPCDSSFSTRKPNNLITLNIITAEYSCIGNLWYNFLVTANWLKKKSLVWSPAVILVGIFLFVGIRLFIQLLRQGIQSSLFFSHSPPFIAQQTLR